MLATGRAHDVDDFVDGQKVGAFNWRLVGLSVAITLMDGYDIVAAPAAGPLFVRDWHLSSPAALTFAFSATNFGVLFGAPLFGWIGDRKGRKLAIISSLVVFGLFTLLVALTTTPTQLAWARFLTGFGIGGVIANTVAFNAEMAPRHVRASFIMLIGTGNTLGGVFPPLVANALAPAHGWPVIFWIGGVLPLVMAAVTYFALPESLKHLALDPSRRTEALALARRMRPDADLGPDDRFTSASAGTGTARFLELFAGRLKLVTPLLWLLFAINLMVYYFVSSWLQTIVTPAIVKAGGSPATAQTAGLMIQLGGAICGIAISRWVDKAGLRPILLLILLGIPCTAAIGYVATTPALVWIAFATGFCVLGVQTGINAIVGMVYPTRVRSLGVGYAFGVGRFGAFGGPAIGGILIGNAVPLEHLYMFAAAPLLVSAAACVALIALYDVHGTDKTAPASAVTV